MPAIDRLMREYQQDLELTVRITEAVQPYAASLPDVRELPVFHDRRLPSREVALREVSKLEQQASELTRNRDELEKHRKVLMKAIKRAQKAANKKAIKRAQKAAKKKAARLLHGWESLVPTIGAALGDAITAGGAALSSPQLEEQLESTKKRLHDIEAKLLENKAKQRTLNDEIPQIAETAVLPTQGHPSLPAMKVLQRNWPDVGDRLIQCTWMEHQLERDSDHQLLLLWQVSEWERVLRHMLMEEADSLADCVLAGLKPGPRTLMQEHLAADHLHTLYVMEHWFIGLRRQLERGERAAVDWCQQTFHEVALRHHAEQLQTRRVLARRKDSLDAFMATLRTRYRNDAAHGSDNRLARTAYEDWCDFAYATGCLHQWMDIGVAPQLHEPQHFGWLSFLAFAARPTPAGHS